MDINHLYDRYRNSIGAELFGKIQEDFGPKAEEQLRANGMLTLNDALKCKSDLLNEALGFRPSIVCSNFGDLVGWICDINKDSISVIPIKERGPVESSIFYCPVRVGLFLKGVTV